MNAVTIDGTTTNSAVVEGPDRLGEISITVDCPWESMTVYLDRESALALVQEISARLAGNDHKPA